VVDAGVMKKSNFLLLFTSCVSTSFLSMMQPLGGLFSLPFSSVTKKRCEMRLFTTMTVIFGFSAALLYSWLMAASN
jgi:hypothetical protein